jgi:hypothetical protein
MCSTSTYNFPVGSLFTVMNAEMKMMSRRISGFKKYMGEESMMCTVVSTVGVVSKTGLVATTVRYTERIKLKAPSANTQTRACYPAKQVEQERA